MALRIAMIAYTHYESDPRVRREAEALAARGDDVTFWCLRAEGRPAEERIEGVRVCRIDIPRYRGGKSVAYVGSYLRFFASVAVGLVRGHAAERFDIVHVHTMPDFMVFTALLPRLSGAKVLLDMHDLMPDLFAVKFGLSKGGAVVAGLRGVQQVATTFADAVICVHEPQYELLIRDGVPAHKLAIVMNCADPKLFAPREADPPVEDEVRVVYHGTVLHRYGVDLAVRALAKARERDPRLVMEILGDGDFMDDVRRIASELGLGPDVFRTSAGRLPLDDIAARIRSAHMGIIPNRDDQEDSVLPTKLLEYVAVGIPAIAAGTRCIRRYFDDTQLEMVPVGDIDAMAEAMLRLAADPERRAARVEAARQWQAQYGYERQMKLLFRTVDYLCWEKIAAQRKARQKNVDGKKTGKRATPPKPSKKKSTGSRDKPGTPPRVER